MNTNLFGDLPSAKNSSANSNYADINIKTNNESENSLFGGLPPAASSSNHPNSDVGDSTAVAGSNTITSNSHSNTANSNIPDVNAVPKSNYKGSLVSSLGVAGTSMAFVPAAIAQARKRKKIAQQQKQQNQKKIQKGQDQSESSNIRDLEPQETSKGSISFNIVTEKNQEVPIKNDADQKKMAIVTQHAIGNDNNDNDTNEPALQNEEQDPPHLRHLHASVTPEQTYNPHFPNDYLAYRERKKTERLRKDLEREARERLEKQEVLRKRIEEERRKIEESGDLEKIVESRLGIGSGVGTDQSSMGVGRGRGRGRGMNNLPAWLIQKRQEMIAAEMGVMSAEAETGEEVTAEDETRAELPEKLSAVTTSFGQFDDAE
ncbi:hypothetical protein ACHAXS_002184 [Conticribra weissflogii]